jgi:hypothetical protein
MLDEPCVSAPAPRIGYAKVTFAMLSINEPELCPDLREPVWLNAFGKKAFTDERSRVS